MYMYMLHVHIYIYIYIIHYDSVRLLMRGLYFIYLFIYLLVRCVMICSCIQRDFGAARVLWICAMKSN